MVKLSRPAPRKVDINLSPLIDVVFILLVFVILVARFIDQERIDVDVPESAAGAPDHEPGLFVYVLADGRVMIDEREVARDALLPLLAALRPRYDAVVLVADRRVVFDAVVEVMSAAHLSGFETVSVATDPPEVAAAPEALSTSPR